MQLIIQTPAFPEGRVYGPGNLDTLRSSGGFAADLADFLGEWFNDSCTVRVQSSGSTGAPKQFCVEKSRMLASARMTCAFLGLKKADRALLCMPLKYIGAKMQVVRALFSGMHLVVVRPSSHPLAGLAASVTLAAMTPAQVYSTLEQPGEAALLRQTTHLLIGGGPVDPALTASLHDFPYQVWSTYGMTETLSHIALRRVNGKEASVWYTPFAGVTVWLSCRGTLCIKAPALRADELETNDIAEINALGAFRIFGRSDNIINSGGVKMQIERLETALLPHLRRPFQISAVPDPHYGEAVTLLVEGAAAENGLVRECAAICQTVLSRYERPKHIFVTPKLPLTGSGKPDRAAARNMARRLAAISNLHQ